jgi:hypothetical protein
VKKPINQSVAKIITENDWGSYLKLPVSEDDLLNESQNDRLKRLQRILTARHFGIMSPHRSFAHHQDIPQKGMRPEGDPAIYRGDQSALRFVGADFRGGKQAMKMTHNAAAWSQLRQTVSHLGFKPLPVTGAFKEKGGELGAEAALVIPGTGHGKVQLSQAVLVNLARRYNQDSFIYAGPETQGKVHLFEVSARGKSGLPTAYDHHFPIGSAETPSDIRSLVQRLYKAEDDPQKIQGLAQPRRHGEQPVKRPTFGTQLGKGKGITFT